MTSPAIRPLQNIFRFSFINLIFFGFERVQHNQNLVAGGQDFSGRQERQVIVEKGCRHRSVVDGADGPQQRWGNQDQE